MEQSLVQILVDVANIQMRSLKTEVEKGSTITVIGCGLVGPKTTGSSVESLVTLNIVDIWSKGNLVNISRTWMRRLFWQFDNFAIIVPFFLLFCLTIE